MTYDPTKLDDLEMLNLLAKGLIDYLEQVRGGEKDPFPYPDALLRGFNQLAIACALQGLERAKRPKSIPEFVEIWGALPLAAWPLQLDSLASYGFDGNDVLIEHDSGNYPTKLCQELAEIDNLCDCPTRAVQLNRINASVLP
ncbi:MAG: hypothetical protein F6K36_15895 [Symploca sp. SIO3C6]|uniref:pPIWI-RE three-gene island domain-containing protein n=1 Tax=Symploca sp. SIO1C4 TaxID=2607765 RepID=A0A6B3N2Z9_9CYAN|nr:hypothetical protein [Symploca sp. SIO3C6]NER28066.1 hypothetical protein [Symploca sp. SIO1C4]NET05882.1 hypothetical protein [Symploca sp. SIO2B6]NET49063.1 hypothetical protein [Merismopedia sp. SIO2A8]